MAYALLCAAAAAGIPVHHSHLFHTIFELVDAVPWIDINLNETRYVPYCQKRRVIITYLRGVC